MKIVSRKALNLNREPGYLIFLTRRISSNTSLDALKTQEVVNLVWTGLFPQDRSGRIPEELPIGYTSGWYIEMIDAADSLLVT